MSLVKIVDAPDQPALDVPPGAEVFHVQVAYRQHMRGPGKFRTNLRPELRPAVVSSTQKGKDCHLHIRVLEPEIVVDQVGSMTQPVFKLPRRFNYVHRAHDKRRVRPKSTSPEDS